MWKVTVFYFIGWLSIAFAQNPCNVTNGGCEDICLWPGSGNATCACRCPSTLSSDGKSCIRPPCNVDMYVGVDVGFQTDFDLCVDPSSLSTSFFTQTYLPSITNFLQTFNSVDTMQYHFGVQTFFGSSTYINISRFGESLAPALSSSSYDHSCSGTPNYIIQLGRQLSNNPGYGLYSFGPPGSYRDSQNTSRIAVVFTSGFFSSFFNQSFVMPAVQEFFDDIIVVAISDTRPAVPVGGSLSCPATPSNCNKNFFIQSDNSFGNAFTRSNFDDVVDYFACNKRGITPSTVSCGGNITLTVPKCALQGLTLLQLQFIDSSCDVSNYATDKGDSYEFRIVFNECGATIENNILSQLLTTRTISAMQNLPVVSFNVTCSFNATTTTAATTTVPITTTAGNAPTTVPITTTAGNVTNITTTVPIPVNPCSISNGGCEDICLWTGSGSATCACRCPSTLSSDGKTCIGPLCNVDMYIGIDNGFQVDFDLCVDPNSFSTSFFTQQYISRIQEFLQTFAGVNSSLYRFGVQTFFQSTQFINVLEFGQNISEAISHSYNIDCSGTPNYIIRLGSQLPSNVGYDFFVASSTPGTYRNKSSTTRIAVVFSSGRFSGFSNESIVEKAVQDFFDDIVVVTPNGQTPAITYGMNLACPSSPNNCSKNFFLQGPNTFGQIFSRANFDNVVNYQACRSRQVVDTTPTVTCGVVSTITILKCALNGLSLSQLQFRDPNCNIADFVTDIGDSYEIILNPSRCNPIVANNSFTQVLTVRQLNAFQQLPNVTFQGTCPLFTTQNPCSMNNGGCSDECLWVSGEPHICTCGCNRRLLPAGYQCENISTCNIDMFIAFDVGPGADTDPCTNSPVDFSQSSDFLSYRSISASFLQTFNLVSSTEKWNIGFQVFYGLNDFENLVSYQDTNYSSAVDYVSNLQALKCSDFSNYLITLQASVPSTPQFPNPTSRSPGFLRNRENTTRIAVVIAGGIFSSNVPENEMRVLAPQANFDDIIVVSYQNTTNSVARLASCGNSSLPCDQNFLFTNVNAFNKAFTRANFDSVVDYNACLQRQPPLPVPEVVRQCTPKMWISIPSCLLKGLSLNQIQLNDPSCDLNRYSNIVNSSYVVSISSFACGANVTNENGTYVLRQRIFTRSMANSSFPSIEFSINCSYPVPSRQPQNPLIFVADGFGNMDFDSLNILASLSSNYVPILPMLATVEVNTPVYFEISSLLVSPFDATLTSCHASVSSDPNTGNIYQLFADLCPVDSTFQVIDSTNSTVRFSFQMFEFTGADAGKPIYIHCQLAACYPGSSSSSCQQPNCTPAAPSGPAPTGRKRRDVRNEKLHQVSFGPLIVRGDHVIRIEDVNPVNLITRQAQKNRNMDYFCVFLLLIGVLVTVLVCKFSAFLQFQDAEQSKNVYLEKLDIQ